MGRPYRNEIGRFPETYGWSMTRKIEPFAAIVRQTLRVPLVALGSGGSLSAAHFCCDWHQLATGHLARPTTPLETVSLGRTPRDTAVAVYSAGGRNKDIRTAFEVAVASEPPAAWVLLTARQSPLGDLARTASIAVVCGERPPAGLDGFLATNSLLASCVLTHRAYEESLGVASSLPPSWSEFVDSESDIEAKKLASLWAAETIVVLHGYGTRAAAMDFESKCTEAALAQVQVSDYRNFAHGRHNWLSKRGKTVVFALVAPEDAIIAHRTLDLLPQRVSSIALKIPFSGMAGGLHALIAVMRIVEAGGRAKEIDPGRPGVEKFGRKLYSLRVINDVGSPHLVRYEGLGTQAGPIQRKARKPLASFSAEERRCWRDACVAAERTLQQRDFVALVLDYDGTVVDVADRFKGPRGDILAAMTRLLREGLPIGIATGRGHSAGDELRKHLPKNLWKRVIIGYYNGSVIAPLSEKQAPPRSDVVGSELTDAFDALSRSTMIVKWAHVTAREHQITIEASDQASIEDLWDATHGALMRAGVKAQVVRSTHSIDILGRSVSKLALVTAVRDMAKASRHAAVLRIGDAAVWPGNDAELLAGWDGMSVSGANSDPEGAWNFASPGTRGVAATLEYLNALTVDRNGRAGFSPSNGALRDGRSTSIKRKPRGRKA